MKYRKSESERKRERYKSAGKRDKRETLGKYKVYYDIITCHIKPALSRPLRPMIREREINESDFFYPFNEELRRRRLSKACQYR